MSEAQKINATELNATIETLKEQRNVAQDQVAGLVAKLAVANEQLQYIQDNYDFDVEYIDEDELEFEEVECEED